MNRLPYPVLVLAGWLASAGAVFAQGDAAAPAAPPQKVGMLQALGQGGIIGFVIIGLSVVAGTLIVEHFMSIKREKLAPPEAVDEIEELMKEGNYNEILEYCEAEPNFFTNVVSAGVRKLSYPFSTVEKALEEAEDEEGVKLHQKIGWLSLISGISPMLGLFGTVTGMVGAFGTIATQSQVEPKDFAADIQLALITTVLGLTVAIPVTAFYVFFRNRVTIISIEVSAMVEELFEAFRPTSE